MKSVEERMSRLLVTEQDAVVLNEQMLVEAISAADALLESNGLELKAESVDDYVMGLQDILENYELSEEDRAELQEIFGALVRGVGHIAGGVGKAVGTYKRAKTAVKQAIGHVGGAYRAGAQAGEHPEPKPVKAKEPGFFRAAWASGGHPSESPFAKKSKSAPEPEKAAAAPAAKAAEPASAEPAAKAVEPAPAAKAAVSKSMARRVAAAKAERDARRVARKQKQMAPPASPEKAPWHPPKKGVSGPLPKPPKVVSAPAAAAAPAEVATPPLSKRAQKKQARVAKAAAKAEPVKV